MPSELSRNLLSTSTTASQLVATTDGCAACADEIAQSSAVMELVELSEQANAALMRGDVARYRELAPISDDFTLLSPFGGKPTSASSLTEERWESVGRFFRNGNFRQDVIATYSSRDLVVLALTEQTRVEVGGLPTQDWKLRVTLVFRRDAAGWRLVHRHADPLAAGISLEHAAALGRGETR